VDATPVPARVHCLSKVPVLFVCRLKVPDGTIVFPGDVSVTVTVHVEGLPRVVVPHEIEDVVVRTVTKMLVVVPGFD
jgi:hypothetical protein